VARIRFALGLRARGSQLELLVRLGDLECAGSKIGPSESGRPRPIVCVCVSCRATGHTVAKTQLRAAHANGELPRWTSTGDELATFGASTWRV